MTSSDIPSRKPFAKPFASGASFTPIPDAGTDTVNMEEGFPSVYSVPAAEGGKYVGRNDMNALLNLSTNDLFYHKCGGLNTFDADFAAKVGGYPKGAILKYIDGTDIYDVVSLVDDNKVDFTGAAPTQSQQTDGILQGSVDGVHWAFCNVQHPTRERLEVLSLENLPVLFDADTNTAKASPVCAFTATKSGALVANLDATIDMGVERSADIFSMTEQVRSFVCGVGVIAMEYTNYGDVTFPTFGTIATSPSKSSNWRLLAADTFGGSFVFTRFGCHPSTMAANISALDVVAGRKYVVAVLAGSCEGFYEDQSFHVSAHLTTTVNSLKVYID